MPKKMGGGGGREDRRIIKEKWRFCEGPLNVKCFVGRQGCISCGVLLSGTGARGVSSEHMENMEMFSCSPT